MRFASFVTCLAAILSLPALSGCSRSDDAGTAGADAQTARYSATVRRTALGIPHVKANDVGSLGYGLGYGLGYAQAQDNLCTVLDDIVTDRGERSRYFGPDGTYSIPANGVTAGNVDSDFFWKLMLTPAVIANLKAKSLPDALAATEGYRQGFNRYVREVKAGGHSGRHARCRDAAWLIELDGDDMYRRYLRLGVIASSSVFIKEIANAQPPSGGEAAAAAAPSVAALAAGMRTNAALQYFAKDRPFGSNMYAIGSQASTTGIPLVFGNPHFPWEGTERLYIFHATVPGQIDIMGAALYGVPAVLIGFNDHFAWSHTVSTAFRFTFYELTLSPDSPTSYVYDGAPQAMEAVALTIKVQQPDGSLADQSRTLYRSKFGPVLTLAAADGVDLLPWTENKAYTLRDANFENDRLINQFFHWNKATSLEEFISLHKSVLGIPWVNTIASGPGGKAYYGDVSVVPNVPNTKLATCANNAAHNAIQQVVPGLPVLDGSVSVCEWDTDADAPAPGIFGPGNLPTLERDDWVHNCNDSYWLSNPAAPLTGFAGIIGAFDGRNPANEQSERSMRTRLCMQQALRHLGQEPADGLGVTFDANGDQKFDLDELQETVLSSQIYTAQLARDSVVDNLCPAGTVATSPRPDEDPPYAGGPVDIAAACTVLGAWSMQSNLADVGSHIWREFFRRAAPNPAGLGPNPALWQTPFSAADPVNTPRDLNFASPTVQDALGRAVVQIDGAGIAMDAPLGSLQRSGVIGDTVIPIFGGTGTEGAFTIVSTNNLDADGYRVTYGNSYIQTVTWEAVGGGFTPIAEGFITYSQSTDPASPHFFDFTEEYSAKRWHRFPFREADVAAQAVETLLLAN
jgi:acyl-homoserine-lactone acylase